jgi:hypothetical protein
MMHQPTLIYEAGATGRSFIHLIADNAVDAANQNLNPVVGGNLGGVFNPLDKPEFWLCVLCILFGFTVLFGQFYLLHRLKTISSDDIVKNSTITIVIIGALILIIAGYNSQQTAQAFGLFGTIVGYLLGRSARLGDIQERQENKP